MTAADSGNPKSSAADRPREEATGTLNAGAVTELLRSIAGEFEAIMDRPERVEADCARLRRHLSRPPTPTDIERLRALLPLLRRRIGSIAATFFLLLEEMAESCSCPWLLLEGMLAARDDALARRALDQAARLAERGSLEVGRHEALYLAERVEEAGSPLAERSALRDVARILGRLRVPPIRVPSDPVADLYVHESEGKLRRLAARVLDLDDQPVRHEMAESVLGPDTLAVLAPYLSYTRATHLGLLSLSPAPGGQPPLLPSLRRAEALCGPDLLKEVIAELGWARVNLGIEIREYVGVSVGGSLPLLVLPAEASLLQSCAEARREFERLLIVAHGGPPAEGRLERPADDAVGRFRAYNLVHAEMLAEILDVAPLTRDKVQRALQRMDRIVEDFIALFATHTEECAILPQVYGDLRRRIVSELEPEPAGAQLSAELTRLVQTFEDPHSLGEVRTLHGLKRYLHQRGLRLGFRLVEAGRATNRTVDLVVASRSRVLHAARPIQYMDFEPDAQDRIPYPVSVVADGFGRQILHGDQSFPIVRIFLYGNEVHYYLAFGNHPAFLRVDYAPPLQGGMIDLEFYGVSKYELSLHPNPSLDAIRLFFRRLEFDAEIESTRIHARYDKERALDIGDLCRKAEIIFCLVPHLMEVDWIIGYLSLDAEARQKVAEAWAEAFAHWAVLPIRQLLTKDRQGILAGVETDAAGHREIPWSGQGAYRDRYTALPPARFLDQVSESVEKLELQHVTHLEKEPRRTVGQIDLERALLSPLREAAARGEILATADGFRCALPEQFQREHEAEIFAGILDGGRDTVSAAARCAGLVSPLERSLRFRTTGSVNGREIQQASLALRGEALGLFVLRDDEGMIRLALFSRGAILCRRREDPSGPWRSNWSCGATELASLLRRSSILVRDLSQSVEDQGQEAQTILDLFRRPAPPRRAGPLAGERIITGLRASPGRAVGTALFGTQGRAPEDLDGAVLIAPNVRPEDNTFLYHAAGVVSTGGGILSHAGLIAMQFHKPALIIAGQWRQSTGRPPVLLYRTSQYREEEREVGGCRVSVRRDVREPEHLLREGDLVVLDAGEGTLLVLGQDRQALALHEELRSFGEASHRLARATDERDVLVLRGRRLRARHQIERLLSRLTDLALARHAVHEILLGETFRADAGGRAEKADLLSLALGNRWIGTACQDCLARIGEQLAQRSLAARERVMSRVPTSSSVHEVLALRLEALRLRDALDGVRAASHACGLPAAPADLSEPADIDAVVRRRLEEIRQERTQALRRTRGAPEADFRPRHLLRQLDQLDQVLGLPAPDGQTRQLPRARLRRADRAARERLERRRVLGPADGGFELFPFIGWKAANLAEVERLGGGGLVPPWFVVTDAAFEQRLDAPLKTVTPGLDGPGQTTSTLREAIDAILARPEVGNDRKSALIRSLWDEVELPGDLAGEVLGAYRDLAGQDANRPRHAGEDPSLPLVAIRSSAREEDTEAAARAGEFETFLFVRGEKPLLDRIKRAWSGLWTERAIHNRALLSKGFERIGGGVIIQRMVWSRVSGVLLTVNVAEGELREMVINAGLGLGEGIVSGAVAADHIVVARGEEIERGSLRFRYVTGDKREQVVFDERAGLGTRRAETLYHQRLRPALEYVELCDLVRVASRLEAAYGYPLDIEFGIEGARLWILQARPVAAFLSALNETVEHHPLAGQEECPAP